jgi:hypothetical protein
MKKYKKLLSFIALFLFIIIFGLIVANTDNKTEEINNFAIEWPVSYISYFQVDKDNNLIKDDHGNFIRSINDIYITKKQFIPKESALIVMDPWENPGDNFLRVHNDIIFKDYLLPLINKMIDKNFTIIILTNKPSKDISYDSAVYIEIQKLIDLNHANLIYHDDYSPEKFIEYLTNKGINTLIYSGFASNMCIINRPLGMVRMQQAAKFRLFFVPEASGAVEVNATWEEGEIHKIITLIIGQTIGGIIHIKDIL